MNLGKVQDALADLLQQREIIDEAIKSLRLVVASAEGDGQKRLFTAAVGEGSGSYIDLAVGLITSNAGKPMHVKTIVEHIRKLRGNPAIKRQSVEATFFRHAAAKGSFARLVKVSPGMYGLRRYPREELAAKPVMQKIVHEDKPTA